jgi:hypothetical protein
MGQLVTPDGVYAVAMSRSPAATAERSIVIGTLEDASRHAFAGGASGFLIRSHVNYLIVNQGINNKRRNSHICLQK